MPSPYFIRQAPNTRCVGRGVRNAIVTSAPISPAVPRQTVRQGSSLPSTLWGVSLCSGDDCAARGGLKGTG